MYGKDKKYIAQTNMERGKNTKPKNIGKTQNTKPQKMV